jgi:hypothetical protein
MVDQLINKAVIMRLKMAQTFKSEFFKENLLQLQLPKVDTAIKATRNFRGIFTTTIRAFH